MKRLAVAVLAAGTMAVAPALAASGIDIVTHGVPGSVPACLACHGLDGAGRPGGGIPRIGGLDAAYMRQQFANAVSGARGNTVMVAIAKALDPDAMTAVTDYYARQNPPAVAEDAPADAIARGQRIAEHGVWSRGVPSCTLCHGAAGMGIGTHFPRLNGQVASYIQTQLKDWQAGTRRGDPMGLMAGIARKLTKADIADVAAYFAALPRLPALPAAVPAGEGQVGEGQAGEGQAGEGQAGSASGEGFVPPPDNAIPHGPFGDMVRLGLRIFDDPQRYAADYTGNSLQCRNCHLDAGRLANSAPLWAAYVAYPAWRAKNGHVNSFAERLQGCFRYSLNGKAPPLGDRTLLAVESYAYFLATGAPTRTEMKGRGYPTPDKPAMPMDARRGATVYAARCALCHGEDGQGQKTAAGAPGFPPLWGAQSFNWGAGMADIRNAAGFIKANMPLSQGGSLSGQEAWDLAMFIDTRERPQDPRFAGSVEETRAKYHEHGMSMYGQTMNGVVLGSAPLPPGH
ncbi:c-type cytochrome [Rhodopila globiformis]|nr:c-type cytochrome [Rhodopila globiformis]